MKQKDKIAREASRKIAVEWRCGYFRKSGGVVNGMTPIILAAITEATEQKDKIINTLHDTCRSYETRIKKLQAQSEDTKRDVMKEEK